MVAVIGVHLVFMVLEQIYNVKMACKKKTCSRGAKELKKKLRLKIAYGRPRIDVRRDPYKKRKTPEPEEKEEVQESE